MKMKSIVTYIGALLIVLVLLVVGCADQKAPANDSSNPSLNNESLRIAEIALPGMFCQACAMNAEITFKGIKGVVDSKVDIKTKRGTVIYDASITSKEQLMQGALIQAYDGSIVRDESYQSSE